MNHRNHFGKSNDQATICRNRHHEIFHSAELLSNLEVELLQLSYNNLKPILKKLDCLDSLDCCSAEFNLIKFNIFSYNNYYEIDQRFCV